MVVGTQQKEGRAPSIADTMVEQLRDDIVRLSERLSSVVATNAELLRERCDMTAKLQVQHLQVPPVPLPYKLQA